MQKRFLRVAVAAALAGATLSAQAAAIFLTGHDPDFHALVGGNAAGAQHINQTAISFVTSAANNSFTAAGVNKFLFVESSIAPPGGHVDGLGGVVASGYVQGVNFDKADASGLNAAIDNLGTSYNALVIASDFGGILTQAELDILRARSADIIKFLNKGGGIYAMAEGNNGVGLTPNGGWFSYLPFVVSAANKNQGEVGFAVSSFGAGLGLTNSDVNGNASHNVFLNDGGLHIVDSDAQGQIMSIAGVTASVPTPEPEEYALMGLGLLGLAFAARRRT